VTSCNDFILAVPDKTVERQQTGGDIQHCPGRLFRRTGVNDRDTAVVSSESKSVSTRRECDTLDPASRVVQKFTADSVEGKTLSPGAGLWAGVNAFDEAREDSCMRVGGTSGQQHGVWVPSQSCDGASNRLLKVLRDPPVVLLLKVTDGDQASSGTDGEFLLGGRPSHKGRGTVDTEEDERRLPARGGLLPDVCIAVCGAVFS